MFASTSSLFPPSLNGLSPLQRTTDRFMVKSEGSFIFLRVDEVEWIEAQGDYVKFHAGPRSCMVRMTMTALGASLDPERFLRVHRSAAVNIDRIEKISPLQDRAYEVVLRQGSRIRVSGAYRAKVREFYRAAIGPAQADPRDDSRRDF